MQCLCDGLYAMVSKSYWRGSHTVQSTVKQVGTTRFFTLRLGVAVTVIPPSQVRVDACHEIKSAIPRSPAKWCMQILARLRERRFSHLTILLPRPRVWPCNSDDPTCGPIFTSIRSAPAIGESVLSGYACKDTICREYFVY